ncbi:hypothetical protein F5Y03DRAFT_222282 [Xylaria venustula]|nr:hypothetical protein F5Y03DRAFT_222282 [Xylaria venustula]
MPVKRNSSDAPPKLRQACDFCHGVKIRCSGGSPCEKCNSSNIECHYSYAAKSGKPKGSRHKKTLARLAANAAPESQKTTVIVGGGGAGLSAEETDGSPSAATTFSSTDNDSDESRFSRWPNGYGSAAEPLDMQFPPGSTDARFVGHRLSLQTTRKDVSGTLPGSPNARTSAYHDLMGDKEGEDAAHSWCAESLWRDGADWQELFSAITHQPAIPDNPDISPLSLPAHGLLAECVVEETEQPCRCLKKLADHLCHLNALERRSRAPIQIDTALCETDTTLDHTAAALRCNCCRRDSKVVLLVATVLQTVLNWIRMDRASSQTSWPEHPPSIRPSPKVRIGAWEVSEADGNLVKSVLTNRVLASSNAALSMLRTRIDEIAHAADNARGSVYQALDVEQLRQMLQRLDVSMRDLGQHNASICP